MIDDLTSSDGARDSSHEEEDKAQDCGQNAAPAFPRPMNYPTHIIQKLQPPERNPAEGRAPQEDAPQETPQSQPQAAPAEEEKATEEKNPQPKSPPAEKTTRRTRSDMEFLPAAVSILETPLSPVNVAFIWIIIVMALSALLWSYFGRIDIVATAQGKFQPTGRVKTIQAFEGGKVVAINIENGKHVTAGQILAELDPSEARADQREAHEALIALRAEAARRRVGLDAERGRAWDPPPQIVWSDDIPQDTRDRQQRVLNADLKQLAMSTRSYDAQIAQKQAEARRLEDTVKAQQNLVNTLRERVDMRADLMQKGAGAKAGLIDAQESMLTQATSLAAQKGQLEEAKTSILVAEAEREKGFANFIAEYSQKLAEIERQMDEQTQKLIKAQTRLDRLTIVSPIDGVVMGSSLTTKGQVLVASEEIMRIVPDNAGLEIECFVENKDIGFVKEGQSAVVKVESFPFTRYGSLEGTVIKVAHDAIPQPDAQSLEGNPAHNPKSSYFGGAQRVQNLVYPVTLTVDRSTLDVDGLHTQLMPGMTVVVEIRTGSRRILEYVFSPLVETMSKALHER